MEQLRLALMKVINESELPFDAKYYILKDVYRDAKDLYEGALAKESSQNKQEEKENDN